jgi:hypothetical protein
MNRIKLLLGTIVLGILFSSCATVFGGKKNTIKINGNIPQSEVYLDGEYLGKTPLKMRIPKHQLQEGSVIEIRNHDYQSYFYEVNRRPHVGYVLLDVVTGAIPLIVDVATGNIYRPNTRNIEFELKKDSEVKAINKDANLNERKKQ